MDTEKIRQEIEILQCPKHRKYPFLVFQPGNIKLTNVCCNEFEAELKDRIENLTVKESSRSIR